MADCLISPVKEIAKCILTQCVWPPIKSHFDYWWCFDSNIQSLRDGIRDLEGQIYDVTKKIEEARNRCEVVRPGVEVWLKASTEKLEEAGKILLPDDNIPKAYRLNSRYSMGKNAKEIAEEIAKLRNNGNFNPISEPAPPPAMGSPYHGSTMEFESRKSIEKDIVDCLKEESTVGMIVIFGMGGVGKTAMAKRIRERVKEEDKFAEVVMVTVSQTIDDQQIQKIRSEIAEWLKLELHVMHETTRAAKLRERLMRDTKRKIIILDDVWDSFKSKHLEDLGIPIESKMCKVLLTSRYADACKGITNKKVFQLKILEEDEAWRIFKDKAGDCGKGVEGSSVPRQVAKECKGLPLALVTVGLALRNIADICTWDNALSQLKKANPEDFLDVSRDVYNHLKLSYDFLENDKERDLFLLCCLFPEDFNISVEQLTWYSMGLKLFPGVDNIKEARERTHTLVGRLESRSLLIHVEKEEGKKGLQVKMHDVTRDVAIYIGSIVKDGFLKSLTSIENSSDVNCNWMSVDISNEEMEVPVLSRFPKLRLLMLSSSNECDDISRISFEGVEHLNVLSFQGISIRSLPPTLGSLENLQTLRLFRCKVESISVNIGKLTSLKILSFCECPNITELPAEIGRLEGLRLLELNRCTELRRIPYGIISSLSRLEELKIFKSFFEWETRGERRNASLTELERLRNLTCLEIEISDCTSSAQEIRLSQKLVRYRICIPACYYYADGDYERAMNLELGGAVGNWIKLLARNAEFLSLRGDGSDNINLAEIENLRILKFRDCSTVKKLVDSTSCYLNQNVSLCNLKSIYVHNCSNLKSLFSVRPARRCLLQLEFLRIEMCESMEEVFWNEVRDDDTDGCIEFPMLKELNLWNLPNLTAFCRGLENITFKFPNLTEMGIGGLPKLNSLFPLNSETQDVLFSNLKSIRIYKCDNLKSLFSVWAARRCLLQLEDLRIEECESMEIVFWNEVRDDDTDGCIEFPMLKKLNLWNLPNLTALCRGLENITFKFPNLRTIDIRILPKLNSLFPLNSETQDDSFGNLQSICIIECHNLRSLFSVSEVRRCRLQLEVLRIKECESMEQVLFWNEHRDDKTDDGCIEFPKLKELSLRNLPNLTAFCRGLENITIKFPNLTEMEIGGLPKLNSLSHLNSETLVCHDQNTSFLFVCNPKVEMGGLKDLTIKKLGDNITNIWCHQIPNYIFNNLNRLSISYINGIRSLMSTSIAKNLVRLKNLIIRNCEEMVEVIENDDDKQVVDIICLFPNFKFLKIRSMPKLKRFWQLNHVLELPLLEGVYIENDTVMETFTLGSLNTPNIKSISINDHKMGDNKDLNQAIHQYYRTWSQNKEKNKHKNEDVDEEGNGDNDENKDEDENGDRNKDENKDYHDHFKIKSKEV